MALKRISDYTDATLPLAGTEMLEVETAGGDARKVTAQDIADLGSGGGGGATAYTIVTEASAFTADPGTHDGLAVLTEAGGDVTFDSAEPYTAGMVFNIDATAPIELIEDGVTLTPPAGGTLELDAGMAVQVVMKSSTTGRRGGPARSSRRRASVATGSRSLTCTQRRCWP